VIPVTESEIAGQKLKSQGHGAQKVRSQCDNAILREY